MDLGTIVMFKKSMNCIWISHKSIHIYRLIRDMEVIKNTNFQLSNSKGASTSSNIASNIAGNCVADPSTLSKFPATRSKIAGNTGIHTQQYCWQCC